MLPTIKNIGAPQNGLGPYVPIELCRLPPDHHVVELKYCELCGKPFSRKPVDSTFEILKLRYNPHAKGVLTGGEVLIKKDRGNRFCLHCQEKPFEMGKRVDELKEGQEKYKEQLPQLDSIHLSSHPIRYDETLKPMGRETNAHRSIRQVNRRGKEPGYYKKRAEQTKALVLAAFKEKTKLTMEELMEIVPECYGITQLHPRLKALKITPRLVGFFKPNPCQRGRGMGVYVLDGVSNVHQGQASG